MRFIFSILVLFFLSTGFVFAQSVSSLVEDRKKELEAELAQLEAQIKIQEELLAKQKGESATYSRDVAILSAEIEKAKLSIKSKTVLINKLGGEIKEKTKTIGVLSDKIERQKDSLAELIRKTNEADSASLAALILSSKKLSEFYTDAQALSSVEDAISESVSEIENSKEATEKEKTELSIKQDAEIDAKMEQENQKRVVEKKEGEKKTLLGISKNKEKEYEKIKAEREKKAAEIRSALFALRDTAAIPFGQALEYATNAFKRTNVRPAFILAILKQESNMGENIGTCNRASDPPAKKWRSIMKPTRDQEPFVRITSALGLNPDNMPLSCPAGGGWGGAMGPSQFIPSTWEIFKSKLSSALSISGMPNPWEPKHAIMASSLYLYDLGAGKGGYTAERNAACAYYSGRKCDSKKPANSFYGDSVMKIAADIQENMIDPLQGI